MKLQIPRRWGFGHVAASLAAAAAGILTGAEICRAGGATPQIDYLVFRGLVPQTTAQARKVWRPSECAGPVSVLKEGNIRFVRFPCQFDREGDRAYWDADVSVDLRAVRGVRFWFRCRDASPVAYFNLYFRSGTGWYSARFSPEATGEWEEITILKSKTHVEERPQGWGHIDGFRISPWKGADQNTSFDIAGIGILEGDADVLIVRGVSGARRQPGEARGISQFAENVATAFAVFGLYPIVIDDADLDAGLLQKARLVVLPYNPAMSPETDKRLSAYVRRGGRVIGFYSTPSALLSALDMRSGEYIPRSRVSGGFGEIRFLEGVVSGALARVRQNSWNINEVLPVAGRSRVAARWFTTDGRDTGRNAVVISSRGAWMTHVYLHQDPVNGPRMILALAGAFVPDVWRRAAERRLQTVGAFGPFSGYADALGQLRELAAGRRDAAAALRQAQQQWEQARALLKERRFSEAIETAGRADSSLREAYYRTRTPRPGEFRGVWCHRAYGISGWTWDESIRRLKEAGFNAVFPNMCWGGLAYYPSDVLPVAPMVKEEGDQLAACLRACRKYGVQLHVWKVDFNLGSHKDHAFVARLKREGRLLKRLRGSGSRMWLCPSHPLNKKLEVDAMLEIVRKYPVDGIHFDYIRYPGADACFCDGCRKRFEQFAGVHVQNWPDDVLKDGPLAAKWLDFRRKNITDVVRTVHDRAKRIRPDIKISAAVFNNWPSARDSVAQDWVAWCREGLLDFVCPMDYIPSDREFERTVRRQMEWLRPAGVPIYPGIGLSTARFGAIGLISQIEICRRLGTPGFMVFEYNQNEALEVLPHLAKGLTSR